MVAARRRPGGAGGRNCCARAETPRSRRARLFLRSQVPRSRSPEARPRRRRLHQDGNPTSNGSLRVLKVARALSARLAQVDAGNAPAYATRLAAFEGRWNAAIKRWEAKAAPLKGKRIVVQHNSWIYLTQWLGLETIGALEPKPGVPPTSAHLASMVATVKEKKPFAVIRAAYQDPRRAVASHEPACPRWRCVTRSRTPEPGPLSAVDSTSTLDGRGEVNLDGLEPSIRGPACVPDHRAATTCRSAQCWPADISSTWR